MYILPEPPCPRVQEGDAGSYLNRARWQIEHRQWEVREETKSHLRQAIALDASLWEPWRLLADLAKDDAALRLRCYEEAIRRGAGGGTKQQHALYLLELDKFAEAERAYSHIIDDTTSDSPAPPLARRDRALARVQLGDYDGAVSDMSTLDLGWVPFYIRELLGRLQWINGDFAGAYQTFMAEKNEWLEFFRIWSHLCQVGHGLRHAAMPPLQSAEGPPVRTDGVWVSLSRDRLHHCDIGPPQPAVWVWDLLTDLFLDRITPDDVLAAAESALAKTDAWQFPKTLEGTRVYDFTRPSTDVWRSELLFYCGMWHLSKGDKKRACQALGEAAEADMSRSLEKIAAKEQLRRIANDAASGMPAKPVQPLEFVVAPPPPPHPHLYKFVDLDLTLTELAPTQRGPVLAFGGHHLGDKGLATLLSSRNLRYIVRLDLQGNNITAAGMAAFRSSSFVLNIADLNLSDNPIGDEGLMHLLDSAALLALETLDLSNTGLTDAGAQRLVDHEYIKFKQLYLGDALLDITTWLRLADQYGAGLYARGVFCTPYKPPFDPRLMVCFSNPMGAEPSPDMYTGESRTHAPRCELNFLMRDYVAGLWERAAVGRHKSERPHFLEDIRKIREFESKCMACTEKVYTIEGLGGFSMINGGFAPISLRCPDCARTYIRSGGRVNRDPDYAPGRFTCPQGHVLWEGFARS